MWFYDTICYGSTWDLFCVSIIQNIDSICHIPRCMLCMQCVAKILMHLFLAFLLFVHICISIRRGCFFSFHFLLFCHLIEWHVCEPYKILSAYTTRVYLLSFKCIYEILSCVYNEKRGKRICAYAWWREIDVYVYVYENCIIMEYLCLNELESVSESNFFGSYCYTRRLLHK